MDTADQDPDLQPEVTRVPPAGDVFHEFGHGPLAGVRIIPCPRPGTTVSILGRLGTRL